LDIKKSLKLKKNTIFEFEIGEEKEACNTTWAILYSSVTSTRETPDAGFELATNGLTVLRNALFHNNSQHVTAITLRNYLILFNVEICEVLLGFAS